MKKIIPVLDLAGNKINLPLLYADKKVVLSFLCTVQQVSEFSKISTSIKQLNSKLIIIGSGTPQQGTKFLSKYPEPFFELYVDPTLQSFKEFELKRGVWGTFGFGAIKNYFKMKNNGPQAKMSTQVEGDPLQQGGTFVIGPGEKIHFRHVNQNFGDHPNLNEIIEALKK